MESTILLCLSKSTSPKFVGKWLRHTLEGKVASAVWEIVDASVDILSREPKSSDDLEETLCNGSWERLAIFHFALELLDRYGCLARKFVRGSQTVCHVENLGYQLVPFIRHLKHEQFLKCSSKLLVTHEQESTILFSPSSRRRIHVLDPSWLSHLFKLRPTRAVEIMGEFDRQFFGGGEDFVALLLWAQVLEICDDAHVLQTDSSPYFWESHDLHFYFRGRPGFYAVPSGGTYRFRSRGVPPAPRVAVAAITNGIQLETPEPDSVLGTSFLDVLQSRRSCRAHSKTKLISCHDLATFLHYACRNRVDRLAPYNQNPRPPYEPNSRNYPSGGACYEQEIYVCVHHSANLDPGIYYYCPERHQLVFKTNNVVALKRIAQGVSRSWGNDQESPQVTFVICARFERVAWKYESIAMSIVQKNLGALLQTMYLVATSMNIGVCALGGGDFEAFDFAVSNDALLNPPIGMLALGHRAGSPT